MSGDSLSYRENVVPADVENVRKIVESSGFFSAEEVEIAIELVNERLTRGIQSGYRFLFAERAGNVIAYACYGHIAGTKESFDLHWIAVHQDFRGMGIGKKLLVKTEEEIVRQGGRRIYVETSSREAYTPTRSFYLRCGYRREALLKDFYSPGDAKVIYLKEINSVPDRSTL